MRPSASASRGSGNGYRVLKKGAGMPVILAHDAQEMVLRQKKGARLLFCENPATRLTAWRWRRPTTSIRHHTISPPVPPLGWWGTRRLSSSVSLRFDRPREHAYHEA